MVLALIQLRHLSVMKCLNDNDGDGVCDELEIADVKMKQHVILIFSMILILIHVHTLMRYI